MNYCDEEFGEITRSLRQKSAAMSRTERAQMYIEIYLGFDNPSESTRELFYQLLRMLLPEAMEAEAFEELFYVELDRMQEKGLSEHEKNAGSE